MCISQIQLIENLYYEPDSGNFYWNLSKGTVKKGELAGYIGGDGYHAIKINGRMYKAHRLAWLYMYGVNPKHQIDHIDRNRSNNSIKNLREATQSENQRNVGVKSSNKTGFKGVVKDKGKFRARCFSNGKQVHIGFFDTAIEASNAYANFAKNAHGNFFRNE